MVDLIIECFQRLFCVHDFVPILPKCEPDNGDWHYICKYCHKVLKKK